MSRNYPQNRKMTMSRSGSISSTTGRKRSYAKAGLVIASAVAFSLPGGSSSFQSSLGPLHHGKHDRPASVLAVVTDPKEIVFMELEGKDSFDRRALEDLYLRATVDSDGLSGELVEGIPSRSRSKTKSKVKKIKTSPPMQDDQSGDEFTTSYPERVQFKGLTTGKDGRKRRESLAKSQPRPKSSINLLSRSSTMPGFADGALTDRQKAYQDGIKLAEQRSGRKFIENDDAKKKRRRVNGEAMYKTSAAVPESLVEFAHQIHDIERITPTEELVLGEKTQEAIRLQKIYEGLENKLDREPTNEEWCAAAGKINMEALSQAIEEGLEAKNKLVTSNLRMVQGVVNVYIRNGLQGHYNAGDLMQEGIMALIRAAEKFDPERGFRFSTYAMYWIRSSIKREQLIQSRIVPVPQRLYENHKRILKIQSQLTKDFGRPPTKGELARAVDMSELQLERCRAAMSQRCYSLDQQMANPLKPMNRDRVDTMYDMIESRTNDSDYNELKHMLLREDLMSMLQSHLSEEEVQLLLLRYGMNDSTVQALNKGPLTIAEVSRIVGYKPDKVRRMINRSLKHMKSVIGREWIEYERELL